MWTHGYFLWEDQAGTFDFMTSELGLSICLYWRKKSGFDWHGKMKQWRGETKKHCRFGGRGGFCQNAPYYISAPCQKRRCHLCHYIYQVWKSDGVSMTRVICQQIPQLLGFIIRFFMRGLKCWLYQILGTKLMVYFPQICLLWNIPALLIEIVQLKYNLKNMLHSIVKAHISSPKQTL